MAFDFGSIGSVLAAVMDSDRIDIYRSVNGARPDSPLYTDIPCHAAPGSNDAPDAPQPGAIPIDETLHIHCALSVDLQNGDIIHLRKLAHDGSTISEHRGVIAAPLIEQSRQSAQMRVSRGRSTQAGRGVIGG